MPKIGMFMGLRSIANNKTSPIDVANLRNYPGYRMLDPAKMSGFYTSPQLFPHIFYTYIFYNKLNISRLSINTIELIGW